jgi:hypothetical protein
MGSFVSIEDHFTNIYKNNEWHGQKSRSGTGSDLDNTAVMRPQLVELINSLNIKTMIDAPCGDFNWMQYIIKDLKISNYYGFDIVQDLIGVNKLLHETDNRKFNHLNIIEEILPTVDLIFSRDCLVHFSYKTVKRILENFIESKSKYLLTTTFTRIGRNYFDILDGQWRAINFQLPPFNFPPPLNIICEEAKEDNNNWRDKSLGLWEINTIKDSLIKCGI